MTDTPPETTAETTDAITVDDGEKPPLELERDHHADADRPPVEETPPSAAGRLEPLTLEPEQS